MIDAPIKAALPWYGCKRALASQVIPHLGEHAAYWEPFAGSMAMLFAKPQARQETVCDLHHGWMNFASVLKEEHSAAQLDWKLRRTLVHEGLYREAVEFLGRGWTYTPHLIQPGTLAIDWAYHFFVASWMGMNGISGTRERGCFAKRYTSNGGCAAVRFAAAVDSLPHWHERLRSVAIYQTCGIATCEKVEDRAGTVIYADPPYLKKSDAYLHDFAPADHQRLAAALGRFERTRVVVSYYDHQDLDALYPADRWRKVKLKASKALAHGGRAAASAAPEILLINDAGKTRKSA